MAEEIVIHTNYGDLFPGEGPDNTIFWAGSFDPGHEHYRDPVPVYIHSAGKQVAAATLRLTEEIVSSALQYLEKAETYIRQAFLKDPEKYHITPQQVQHLNTGALLQVEFPEMVFYDNEAEWLLRFASGVFFICDPYGIAVTFLHGEPVKIEDLSDSEPLE